MTRYAKLPVLSVGAQWATRTSNFQKEAVGTQLRSNLNQQAGINLTVPAFNNLYRTDFALAKLAQTVAQVAYLQVRENVKQRVSRPCWPTKRRPANT